jgi:hypothetical protein
MRPCGRPARIARARRARDSRQDASATRNSFRINNKGTESLNSVPLCLCGELKFYFETAANRSDFIKAWNCLSSVLKCSCSLELSESTVNASIATFSTGLAFIFL